jgi:hypothetical protein
MRLCSISRHPGHRGSHLRIVWKRCQSFVPVLSGFRSQDDSFGVGRYWRAIGGLLTGEPYEFRWLRSKQMVKRLELLAGRLQFDVVHADTLGLAPYMFLVPHAGTVLNHHDIESALVQRRAASEQSVVAHVLVARGGALACCRASMVSIVPRERGGV